MEKNFALCATNKNNILTLVWSENKFLNETKNHNPPTPFKLNGRSLNTLKNMNKVQQSRRTYMLSERTNERQRSKISVHI